VTVYPDAEEHIQHRLFRERIRARVDEIRRDPAGHPLRRELLRVELLPYQLDGIAFAAGAGRAVLADDMGLGKTIVLGTTPERATQYADDTFFSICNYEQVLRDLRAIDGVPWDLIVLDEGQRIKNWEAKTSDVIKRLRSRFALVLSGTPLENRLDEL
jgi:SNF2 family DNA or RNA helicase